MKHLQEEQELIAKYMVEHHQLKFITTSDGEQRSKDTISSLMQGVTEDMKDITILLNNEEIIKNASEDFKSLLPVMATFGGKMGIFAYNEVLPMQVKAVVEINQH